MQKTNCQIFRAVEGAQVLSYLENNLDTILILMDIKMPNMNGIEVLKEIRMRNIIIPVLAQTAYALADEIKELKEAGFDEYISKPLIPAELYSKINKIINV